MPSWRIARPRTPSCATSRPLAESSQRLSEPLKASRPEIDWRGIAGLRNILVHDYLGISLLRVWEIVEVFLPQLRAAVSHWLQASPPPGS
jgi:uncharacterized protein with HEPN domain